MQFYHDTAEAYLFIKIVVSPLLCIFGWVLLGKVLNRRLNSYAHWFAPAVVAASLSVGGVLLESYISFYDRRNYILAAAVYLFYFASLPFHLVSFVRLWQTISRLAPSPGKAPVREVEQDETVWPPHPRTPPGPQ